MKSDGLGEAHGNFPWNEKPGGDEVVELRLECRASLRQMRILEKSASPAGTGTLLTGRWGDEGAEIWPVVERALLARSCRRAAADHGGPQTLDGEGSAAHGIGITDTAMLPRPTVEAFDRHLARRALRFDAVVIGGSALVLMGVVQRNTRDVDILTPALPESIAQAAREFAKEQRRAGDDLGDEWLNNGPMQLGDALPQGWRERVQRVFVGAALVFSTLGRPDLLKSKLFALCDRGTDLVDCVALAPTAEELAECLPWVERQDGNELWAEHVRSTLADLGRRLGHVV